MGYQFLEQKAWFPSEAALLCCHDCALSQVNSHPDMTLDCCTVATTNLPMGKYTDVKWTCCLYLVDSELTIEECGFAPQDAVPFLPPVKWRLPIIIECTNQLRNLWYTTISRQATNCINCYELINSRIPEDSWNVFTNILVQFLMSLFHPRYPQVWWIATNW